MTKYGVHFSEAKEDEMMKKRIFALASEEEVVQEKDKLEVTLNISEDDKKCWKY